MDHRTDVQHESHGEMAPAGLIPALQDNGDHEEHGGHSQHDPAQFRDRFWVTLALSVPVVFFSQMFQELLGYSAPSFPGSTWIPPVLGTIIFLYGGWPFLTGALQEARARQPGMMLLI